MAKNLIQDGNTIEIENTGEVVIGSGSPVLIGALLAVAITDIQPGELGDGLTTGVFLLPKDPAAEITRGARVYFDSAIIADAGGDEDEPGAASVGIAWEDAAASETEVAVKINV